MLKDFDIYNKSLDNLPEGRLLITTINAHSYNVSREDAEFKEALQASDVLIPDGISVVWAVKLLTPKPPKGELRKRIKKIAGEDLFYWEMERLETTPKPPKGELRKKRAMFLGSSEAVLAKIKARAAVEFPNVEVHTYSPPYNPEFSDEDNRAMYVAIEAVQPDVLFVGMTAPKQEKWAYKMVNAKWLMVNDNEIINNNKLTIDNREKIGDKSINNLALTINNCHVCCIGAVFDFYAGTVERAPKLFIKLGLEWFYRLIKEPRRMWRRYLIGNVKFIGAVVREALSSKR